MAELRVISADSHVQEPPDLYERLPKGLRERAPRQVKRDGKLYIEVDGRKPRRIDLAEERLTEDDHHREFRHDPEGGRNLEVRTADLKRDGIAAEVIYPNQSLALYLSPDPAYQMAVAQAYNDWAMECFGPHRERFAPVGIVPVCDIAAAVTEVERLAQLGYRSIKIPITHRALPYNRPAYEPFWSAVVASGMVLAFHAFTNSEDEYPEDWGEAEGYGGALDFMVMRMADGQIPVSQLISSGVCDRHPALQFVIVECRRLAGLAALCLGRASREKAHVDSAPLVDEAQRVFLPVRGMSPSLTTQWHSRRSRLSGPIVCCGAAIIRTTRGRFHTRRR
jgi:predicted TIM-barrel fold metal-dependent hydrolase